MSTWRVALRIARRDVVRARGRSLLIAVLVGLPVLVACAADVLARSYVLDPVDIVATQLGDRVQARLSGFDPGTPLMHTLEGTRFFRDDRAPAVASARSSAISQEQARAVLAGALPARDRLVRDLLWTPRQWMRRDGRMLPMSIRELDYADPGLAGLVRQVSGRPPAAAGEVVVPAETARDYGLGLGDTLSVPDAALGTGSPGRTLTVVGLVRPTQHTSPGFPVMMENGWERPRTPSRPIPPTSILTDTNQASHYVIGRPGDLIPRLRVTTDASEATWYAIGPDPIGWDRVQALNRLGTVVVSRALLLAPPPDHQVPLADRWRLYPEQTRADLAVICPVVVGLVLLHVALTAGSAFAVGARRSRRELALIAAVGGQRLQVGAVVLAYALLIGLLAAVVAAAAGVGLGAATTWWLRSAGTIDAPRIVVRLLDVAVLIGSGVLAALMAAFVPARRAARADVVPALTDRRGQAPPRPWLPVIGLLVAATGAGLAWWAAVAASSAQDFASVVRLRFLVVLGVGAGEVGLVMTVGVMIGLAARAARWLPVAGRLALRDAARQRSRTAPAVAAVMAVLAGSTTVTLFIHAMNEQGRRDYRPVLATGMLWAGSATAQAALSPGDLQRLRTRLPELLPVADLETLDDPNGSDGVIARTTRTPSEEETAQAALVVRDLADSGRLSLYLEQGYPGPFSGIPFMVGIAAVVAALAGTLGAVGLAAVEGRADIATMVAVGADPGVRRRVGAAQAAVIAVLGTVLGLASGTLAGIVLIRMAGPGGGGWPLALPWPGLAAIGLGVPLLATAAGFLVSRSRLPLVRRLAQ